MKTALTLISQFFLSYFLGFMLPYFSGIGNGLELIVIPIGMALGIVIAGRIQYPFSLKSISVTLLGSFIGALPLMIPGIALGFIGIIIPFLGGLIAFYGYNRMSYKRQELVK